MLIPVPPLKNIGHHLYHGWGHPTSRSLSRQGQDIPLSVQLPYGQTKELRGSCIDRDPEVGWVEALSPPTWYQQRNARISGLLTPLVVRWHGHFISSVVLAAKLCFLGFVIWHRFDLQHFVLWRHFRIYFGTATYVDYLMFLAFIQLLTQPPCQMQP